MRNTSSEGVAPVQDPGVVFDVPVNVLHVAGVPAYLPKSVCRPGAARPSVCLGLLFQLMQIRECLYGTCTGARSCQVGLLALEREMAPDMVGWWL